MINCTIPLHEHDEKVFLFDTSSDWYDCDGHFGLNQLCKTSRLITAKYAPVYDASDLVEQLQQRFKCYYGIFLSLSMETDEKTHRIYGVNVSWDYISNLNQDRGYILESENDTKISRFVREYFKALGYPDNDAVGFCRKLVQEIPGLADAFRFEPADTDCIRSANDSSSSAE